MITELLFVFEIGELFFLKKKQPSSSFFFSAQNGLK